MSTGGNIIIGPAKSNPILGLVIVAFALFTVTVWIPLDTDTGLVEEIRRQVTIGDALAPSIAGVFLLLGGAMLILFERKAPDRPVLNIGSLGFIASIVLLLVAGLFVMRFAGPGLVALAGPGLVALVNLFVDAPMEYRLLRDSIPWKYVGYFSGGTILLTGMISLVEGRLTGRAVLAAVGAVIILIIIYDLPFDDLLLPPNGDV